MVIANRAHAVGRDAAADPAPTVMTGESIAVVHMRGTVELQRHGDVRPASEPVHTVRAGGQHHGVIMRNNGTGDGATAGMLTPTSEPVRTLTGKGHQSLVVPYYSQSVPTSGEVDPAQTVTTRDRLALVVPAGGSWQNEATPVGEPVPTQTGRESKAIAFTDDDIDDCRFRMFALPEIAGAMRLDRHPDGREYVVTGNKRERMAQYGNAVTPPAMALIVSRLLEVIEAETFTDMFCGADGPGGDAEQDKSRATMWDVVRFAECMIARGRPYKAIVVENVVDAFKWGANDDGGLFAAWLTAMDNLGYEHEIVWLNSMLAHTPGGVLVPQSRDRMYPVFWLKGVRRPNLRFTPTSWCTSCERVVEGVQTWKRPGGRVWGRYGQQYYYTCPTCRATAIPGAAPASQIIDWTLPAERIGDRAKPLAANTIKRIRRGLERLASEPFAIRLLQSGAPKTLTLPLVTLTARHDMAMVLPVAGNTFERTPGNRARDAATRPMDTIHGGAVRVSEPVPIALVVPPMGGVTPRPASDPAPEST